MPGHVGGWGPNSVPGSERAFVEIGTKATLRKLEWGSVESGCPQMDGDQVKAGLFLAGSGGMTWVPTELGVPELRLLS